MKPDYKNWVPKGMVVGFVIGAGMALVSAVLFGVLWGVYADVWELVLFAIFALATAVLIIVSGYMVMWYDAFSYNGKRKLSKQVVEGTAKMLDLKGGEICLDVGCGSGALTIAVAKRNPNAKVIGCDRWGKEYSSFSIGLCYHNAEAEGVTNVAFEHGDATSLPYADETFDAVCSNYVYHNIRSNDRQAILLETLRVLKQGGRFAIHDLFTPKKYGDMREFCKKLREIGFEDVELIDTTNGTFMSKGEATRLCLKGSALLVGKKFTLS